VLTQHTRIHWKPNLVKIVLISSGRGHNNINYTDTYNTSETVRQQTSHHVKKLTRGTEYTNVLWHFRFSWRLIWRRLSCEILRCVVRGAYRLHRQSDWGRMTLKTIWNKLHFIWHLGRGGKDADSPLSWKRTCALVRQRNLTGQLSTHRAHCNRTQLTEWRSVNSLIQRGNIRRVQTNIFQYLEA
jgi:hypothetical protein